MIKMKDKTKWQSRICLMIIFTILISAWQICSDKGVINVLYFSSPKEIVKDLIEMFSTGYIYPHIGITFYAAFMGLLYGLIFGTAAAFIVGNSKLMGHIAEPILVAINGIPLLALGPLFVFWFGIGIKSKIVMATITAFFRVFFNMYAGFKDVDIQLIQTLQLMRASKLQIMAKVIMPSGIPWLLASLKASVGAASLGAIIGEYLGSSSGLGWVIQTASGYYNITRVISCVIVLMTIIFVLDRVVAWIDRKALKWRPTIEK